MSYKSDKSALKRLNTYNMKKQTAVEWLYERFIFAGYATPAEWKEKAKEMEKEQIIEAAKSCNYIGGATNIEAEQYYKETYE